MGCSSKLCGLSQIGYRIDIKHSHRPSTLAEWTFVRSLRILYTLGEKYHAFC